MQKEKAWLLQELDGLVHKGVLDEAAAARVRAHYAAESGPARLGWGMVLLASAGAALVGLGVILIFAHNWEDWTPGVRVALSLAPLVAGQGACFLAMRSQALWWREAAALFTAISAGASIALVAQTYQFGGDLPQFVLTWLLLAAPLIYLLDSSAAAAGTWLLALFWAGAARSMHGWDRHEIFPEWLLLPAFLALATIPLPHLMRHLRLDRSSPRVAWLLRSALIAVVPGTAMAFEHSSDDLMFLTFAGMAAAGALAGQQYFAGIRGVWGNPLGSAGRIGLYILALSLTTRWTLHGLHWPQSWQLLLPAALALLAAWLGWRGILAGNRLLAPVLAAFPLVAWLAPMPETHVFGSILAHLYVLVLAGVLIRAGLAQGRLGYANEGVGVLTALVLLRFFDSDLSYVVRGVGFIVTGVSFFMAVLWLRKRVRGTAR